MLGHEMVPLIPESVGGVTVAPAAGHVTHVAAPFASVSMISSWPLVQRDVSARVCGASAWCQQRHDNPCRAAGSIHARAQHPVTVEVPVATSPLIG